MTTPGQHREASIAAKLRSAGRYPLNVLRGEVPGSRNEKRMLLVNPKEGGVYFLIQQNPADNQALWIPPGERTYVPLTSRRAEMLLFNTAVPMPAVTYLVVMHEEQIIGVIFSTHVVILKGQDQRPQFEFFMGRGEQRPKLFKNDVPQPDEWWKAVRKGLILPPRPDVLHNLYSGVAFTSQCIVLESRTADNVVFAPPPFWRKVARNPDFVVRGRTRLAMGDAWKKGR